MPSGNNPFDYLIPNINAAGILSMPIARQQQEDALSMARLAQQHNLADLAWSTRMPLPLLYQNQIVAESAEEINNQVYWRDNMPANSDASLMVVAPRMVEFDFQTYTFRARLICVMGDQVTFRLVDEPFAGTCVTFKCEFDEFGIIDFENLLTVFAVSEWPQYSSTWRITPSGAVRLSEADMEFAQEQLRFEQTAPEQRAGLLGP